MYGVMCVSTYDLLMFICLFTCVFCLPSLAGVPRAKDLLPYGMRNALDAAVMLGIAEITDVDTIIESFRWMAWCFYCIHVLRLPPATHTLKNLLKCARPFKLADDKVIRNVSGILQRAR